MKFKYDIKDNHYKMYGEANYLVSQKKRYLNNKKPKIKNYMNLQITKYIISMILLILSIILGLGIWVIAFFIISILYFFIIILNNVSYKTYKNGCHKGTIIINEEGITDNSDITVTFSWDKVEFIGVTKNTLAIILDSPFVLILEPNEKIIKEIKKYKDVPIIK